MSKTVNATKGKGEAMNQLEAIPDTDVANEQFFELLDAVVVEGPDSRAARQILQESPELQADFKVMARLSRCIGRRKTQNKSLDLEVICKEIEGD